MLLLLLPARSSESPELIWLRVRRSGHQRPYHTIARSSLSRRSSTWANRRRAWHRDKVWTGRRHWVVPPPTGPAIERLAPVGRGLRYVSDQGLPATPGNVLTTRSRPMRAKVSFVCQPPPPRKKRPASNRLSSKGFWVSSKLACQRISPSCVLIR